MAHNKRIILELSSIFKNMLLNEHIFSELSKIQIQRYGP
jgi:hypothetical protein